MTARWSRHLNATLLALILIVAGAAGACSESTLLEPVDKPPPVITPPPDTTHPTPPPDTTHTDTTGHDTTGHDTTGTTPPPDTTGTTPPPDTTHAPPPDTTHAPPPDTTHAPPPDTTHAPPPDSTSNGGNRGVSRLLLQGVAPPNSNGVFAFRAGVPIELRAFASDARDFAIGGVTLSFTAVAGSGSVSPTSATTSGQGFASTTWTPNTRAGNQAVRTAVQGGTLATEALLRVYPDSVTAALAFAADTTTLVEGSTTRVRITRAADRYGNTFDVADTSNDPFLRSQAITIFSLDTAVAIVGAPVHGVADVAVLAPGFARIVAASGPARDTVQITVTRFIPPASFRGVSAGDGFSCGVTPGGTAYCWGSNAAGQLGDGTSTGEDGGGRYDPRPVQGLPGAVDTVVTGSAHACALTTGGSAYCWGDNAGGQLGDGTTTPRSTAVAVRAPAGVTFTRVSAGGVHTCALASTGAVYCWGNNNQGQVGDTLTAGRVNDNNDAPVPTPIRVQRADTLTFAAVSAGGFHTCAVTTSGAAYCWGQNETGQLGNNGTRDRATPVRVQAPTLQFAAVSAGGTHTCAITTGGDAYCWGDNSSGQVGATPSRGDPYVVLTPIRVTGAAASGVVSIAAGGSHSCAVVAGGVAYCWGQGQDGRLGDGRGYEEGVQTPVRVAAPGGVTFSAVDLGENHSCALGQDKEAYCWGSNRDGELGTVTSDFSTVPVRVQSPFRSMAQLAAIRRLALARPGGAVRGKSRFVERRPPGNRRTWCQQMPKKLRAGVSVCRR